MNIKERFDSKWTPEPFSGCWLWNGAPAGRKGYGRFRLNGKVQLAHRVAWQIYRGEIPEFLCVLHDCDTSGCVNPDHLHIGTVRDNAIEAVERGHWVNINGERNGNARLTNAQVIEIRNLIGISNKAIARRFGVSPSVIDKVRTGASWKHLLKN